MVLDPSVLVAQRVHSTGPETDVARADRVRHIAEHVKNGTYAVHARRLAAALLEWDPRRGTPKGSAEVADRRRAYMRDYMRRRRATRHVHVAQPPPSAWSAA